MSTESDIGVGRGWGGVGPWGPNREVTAASHSADPGSDPAFQVLGWPGAHGWLLQGPDPGTTRGCGPLHLLHPRQHPASHQVSGWLTRGDPGDGSQRDACGRENH